MKRNGVRLRITFSKDGPLAYTSHLDLMRAWERALRRAGVPLAYSQGFNPRPRLQLAAALPLGHTGTAELLDVRLERPVTVASFARTISPVLPAGLAISQVRQVSLKEPSLPTQVVAAEYQVAVEWNESVEQIEARIERLLAATKLPRERRGKQYDLRPLVERLWLEGREAGSEAALGMQLAAREGATGRPEAVLDALGMGDAFARYQRRRLMMVTALDDEQRHA